MRECVWALYFSPTGGTKKAALYLAESLGKEVKEADLADPDFKGAAFKEGELVVAAAPAFGGHNQCSRLRRPDSGTDGRAFKAGEGKRGHGCDCGGLWKQGF